MSVRRGVAEQRLLVALRKPVVRYRRRRWSHLDPLSLSMLEAVGYRRSLLEFMGAMHENPAILVDAPLDEASTVVDAGAYRGEWSLDISQRYGSRVIAFEPAPRYYAELTEALAPFPAATCVPAGLGRDDLRGALAVTGPGSRIVAREPGDNVVDVELRDVAAVLDELAVEHVDLMKLNIEGGEFDVLDRLAETGWLDRIDDLIIQFHDWYPGAPYRRRHARRALARTHTEVWNYPWVWERWCRRAA